MNAHDELQQQIGNSLASSMQFTSAIAEQAKAMTSRLNEAFAGIQFATSSLDDFFAFESSAIKALLKELKFDNLVFTDQDCHKTLMKHGWVMPLNMSSRDIRRIVELFETNPDEANEELCESLEGSSNHIRNSLIEQYSSRAGILNDAFDAHEDDKYNLSVPVFLAQADGMWKERCKRNLFFQGTDNAIRSLADDHSEGSFIHNFVIALLNPSLPLFLSANERPPNFEGLNRHLVLHGESLNYGTRKNSLQAIAFVDYCGMILPDLPNE